MSEVSARDINRRLVLLILSSLVISAVSIAFDRGLSNTPYETVDSLGRPMGFNNSLHAEHYRIMLSNFRPTKLLHVRHAYDWLLFAAQLTGVALLLRNTPKTVRFTRWYFIGQWLLFPIGAFFIVVAPSIVFSTISGRGRLLDREDFIDGHLAMLLAHGCWLWVATIIAIAMRGPGFGMRERWERWKIRRRERRDAPTDCAPSQQM